MRRAPSIVFEDVGIDHACRATPTLTSPLMLRRSIAADSGRVSDSALNSLECWDYSVELECLSGADGWNLIFKNFLKFTLNKCLQ
jgi:hypothetical protein